MSGTRCLVAHCEHRTLTAAGASEITTIPKGTLRDWRYNSKGPQSFHLGQRVAYLECDVRAWINAQRQAAVDGAA